MQDRTGSVTTVQLDRLTRLPDVAAQDEALRELLSYCRGRAETSGESATDLAYDDVADKLAKILDGEQ